MEKRTGIKKHSSLGVLLALVMVVMVMMAMMPGEALAAGSAKDQVTVQFSAGVPNSFDAVNDSLTVTGDLAEKYFPAIAANEPSGVSFADALVAAHIEKYGPEQVTKYLSITNGNYGTQMNKQFGRSIVGLYYVNNKPLQGSVSDAIEDGDVLYALAFADYGYSNLYAYFDKNAYTTTVDSKVTVRITADNFGQAVTPNTATIATVKTSTGKLTNVKTTYNKGLATFTFSKAGTYWISAGGTVTYTGYSGDDVTTAYEGALAKVTVKAKDLLMAKAITDTTGTKATVGWNKVAGAERYVIYAAKCNTKKNKYPLKKMLAVKSSLTSLGLKGLKKGSYYKFRVIAQKQIDGKWTTIKKSKVAHAVAGQYNKKFTDAKKLTVKKKTVTIKKGKTSTIQATITGVKKGRKPMASGHAAKLRYTSTDKTIATVSAKGKITAKKKGTCKVYVQTVNGIWKAVSVTVK